MRKRLEQSAGLQDAPKLIAGGSLRQSARVGIGGGRQPSSCAGLGRGGVISRVGQRSLVSGTSTWLPLKRGCFAGFVVFGGGRDSEGMPRQRVPAGASRQPRYRTMPIISNWQTSSSASPISGIASGQAWGRSVSSIPPASRSRSMMPAVVATASQPEGLLRMARPALPRTAVMMKAGANRRVGRQAARCEADTTSPERTGRK